jgi:integrase
MMKVRGVNRVRKPSGAVYYYHRASGRRIDAAWGTAEFAAKLAQVEREWKSGRDKSRAIKGTFGALVEAYRKSPEFAALSAETRSDYNDYLDWLAPMADVDVQEIDTSSLIELRDKFAGRRSWSTANRMITVLSLLCTWGAPRRLIDSNPAQDVPRLRRPRDLAKANRPWTPRELAVVLERASPEIAAAVALGAFTAMRQKDVLRLSWSAYDGRAISYRQSKTGSEVWVPAHRHLKAMLDALPRRATTIVATIPRGGQKLSRSYTGDGFRTNFFKLMKKLESEGLIGAGLTFHGLRHTAATYLSDAGCDPATIQAVTGHASVKTLEIYTARADRRRRAATAIAALEREQSEAEKLQTQMTSLQTVRKPPS